LDTREKILDLTTALAISENWRRNGVHWKLVAGYFDVLTPDHVRDLQSHRNPLMAAVLDPPDALLPAQARAELAASLRVIDYVLLLGGSEHLEAAIQELQPIEIVHDETADRRRRQALIEHVHRRNKA
jgi:hypothetical protein